MTRDELEKQILLAESGELRADELATLEQELDAHPDARQWQGDTRRLLRSAARLLPDRGPGDFALARIQHEARKRRKRPLLRRHPAVSVLAAAATLAIMVSSWLAWNRPEAPSRVDHTQSLVELMTEDDGADLTDSTWSGSSKRSHEEKLRQLAQQLLDLEGLSGEDLSPVEWEAVLLPTTDPQTHSTRESSASGCV